MGLKHFPNDAMHPAKAGRRFAPRISWTRDDANPKKSDNPAVMCNDNID
jgi:hypothetical protein